MQQEQVHEPGPYRCTMIGPTDTRWFRQPRDERPSRSSSNAARAIAFLPVALVLLLSCTSTKLEASELLVSATKSRLVSLGEKLFSDSRLSADRQTSCATCHQSALAFSDGKSVSTGASTKVAMRNAPTLLNLRHSRVLFWDGRRGSLDELIIEPLTNPLEHGFRSGQELEAAVKEDSELSRELARFWEVAPEKIDSSHVTRPLTAYVASLVSTSSAFDRHLAGGSNAVSPAAERGYRLFSGRAGCVVCHTLSSNSLHFTDQDFHRAATASIKDSTLKALTQRVVEARQGGATPGSLLGDPEVSRLGRFVVTLNPTDIGKFRTPSLRNVAITAPYMHDGSVATLEEAVERELYDREGYAGKAIALSPDEKADLVEFLRSLTDDNYVQAGAK